MSEVTRILGDIEQGDPRAAEQLLPLIYDELRKLAAQKLAQGKPGQALQATALVYEAYLRLVDSEKDHHWNSRGLFFAAAAEAMRRILVDQARANSAFIGRCADSRGVQSERNLAQLCEVRIAIDLRGPMLSTGLLARIFDLPKLTGRFRLFRAVRTMTGTTWAKTLPVHPNRSGR